ncbi:hypothetical protein FJR06_20710 [Dolichospermum sp. UHCC 0352]|nr:hypothetical protein [Dolichospermum sp. UHCC 0299]MTJ23604.1 hypothetical protein [Dolichospermum sp. UHCC 0352]MTJ39440.1 hypothetical protein [Dolichospermum sp. UHCC 0406]
MILGTYRSPLTPLVKGGTRVKVPLFKGDLGGSKNIRYTMRDFSNTLSTIISNDRTFALSCISQS